MRLFRRHVQRFSYFFRGRASLGWCGIFPWVSSSSSSASISASRARTWNIDTPSSAQVARGLSDAGVAQWRRYARELEPVFPVLAPFVAQFGYPES